jgi:hypothetical protein
MIWQEPFTGWTPGHGIKDSDFNRIEGNISLLSNMFRLHGQDIDRGYMNHTSESVIITMPISNKQKLYLLDYTVKFYHNISGNNQTHRQRVLLNYKPVVGSETPLYEIYADQQEFHNANFWNNPHLLHNGSFRGHLSMVLRINYPTDRTSYNGVFTATMTLLAI